VQDDLLSAVTHAEQVDESGFGILVQTFFGRPAAAFSIPPIIHHQDRGASRSNRLDVRGTMRDITGVAVEKERDELRVFPRNPPAMQPHAVQGIHPHIRGSQFPLDVPGAAWIFLGIIHGAIGQKEKNSATCRHGREPSQVKRNAEHEATVARYLAQPFLAVYRTFSRIDSEP